MSKDVLSVNQYIDICQSKNKQQELLDSYKSLDISSVAAMQNAKTNCNVNPSLAPKIKAVSLITSLLESNINIANTLEQSLEKEKFWDLTGQKSAMALVYLRNEMSLEQIASIKKEAACNVKRQIGRTILRCVNE